MLKLLKSIAAAATVLIALSGFATAQSSYEIRAGDTLQFEVLEDASLNRPLLVLPDGSVSVPMVGSISAAGRTLDQLRASMTAALAPSFAAPPTVFLSVAQVGTRRSSGVAASSTIYLMGEIAKPGMVDVKRGTTLLQALAIGGGLTKFGSPKRIQLHRTDRSGNTVVYTFNYDAAMSGDPQQAIVLMSGDVIVVPARHLFE